MRLDEKREDLSHKVSEIYGKQKEMEIGEGLTAMDYQMMIESGSVWYTDARIGRTALDLLKAGICFLGEHPKADAYGNTVPGRNMVEPGTTGSLENAVNFWDNYEPKN